MDLAGTTAHLFVTALQGLLVPKRWTILPSKFSRLKSDRREGLHPFWRRRRVDRHLFARRHAGSAAGKSRCGQDRCPRRSQPE